MVDDETLFRTMQVAAETGALVMVHAENGDAIDVLVREALAAGNTAPRYHALTRPPELEGEATNRAIQLARIAGAPLYVVHVTCKDAVDADRAAARDRTGTSGARRAPSTSSRTSPTSTSRTSAARSTSSRRPCATSANQPVLWDAVRTDVLSAISTDHCAFLSTGRRRSGKDDFSKIPNGAPGLEDRLRMIHHFGVNEGRITLNRMVELLATSPAKLFGLYPRKGTIAPGSRRRHRRLRSRPEGRSSRPPSQHSKSDYNLYEGTEVTGDVDVTLIRGTVVVEDGELQVEPGFGQFVQRARFGEQLL